MAELDDPAKLLASGQEAARIPNLDRDRFVNASGKPFVYDTGASRQAVHAFRDILDGATNVGLWTKIGWRDIKQRYRRSALGPFWVTISMAFMIGTLGMLYATIFKTDLKTYLPFICIGFIAWDLISKTVTEGELAFLELEGLIKQIRLPFTVHIARYIWRNIIVFLHNSVIYLIIALVFGINPGWDGLLVVPGLLLVILNLSWIALALAICCARFRDVPMIVTTVVQMLFFVTPVFWNSEMIPSRTILVHGNPFYHMLEVIREPLLGHAPALESWFFMLGTAALGWGATFYLFTKFRRRIAYWL